MDKQWQNTRGYQLFTRGAFLLLWASTFCWMTVTLGPGIVFYFDQEEAIAEITYLDQAEVEVIYFHRAQDQSIRHRVRIFYLAEDHGLDENKELTILYSKRFPHQVCLPGVHDEPDLSGLLGLIVYSLPLLFFKNAEKSFFNELD